MTDLPPNHHAHYRQFSGLFGYVAALTMVVGRSGDALLASDLARLERGDLVLDIGCGPGTAARLAARRGARVTGVDPSEPMLRLARLVGRLRSRKRNITLVRSGAEDLGLPDDAFTVCWSLASVHHWPDLERGLSEVSRVLRAGGTFVVLEKRTEAGATGNASHGWTREQAHAFAAMLTDRGFSEVAVIDHDHGKRKVVVVTAKR